MLEMSGVDVISTPQVESKTAPVSKSSSASAKESLLALREYTWVCTLCSDLAQTRKSVVFGSGNARADLVFVGEAPGHEEDIQGQPFVGKAGQLLTKIIESIGQSRESVFICNVLKCRPPGNRNPLPQEISNCTPFLKQQLALLKPKVICALGSFAAKTLLQSEQSISSLRGKFYDYEGAQLICTYHPAYLLRNPSEKRKVWEDMKMIRAKLQKP